MTNGLLFSRKAKKKLLCLTSGLFLLSNQFAPLAMAASTQESNNIMQTVESEDIQVIRQMYTDGYVDSYIPMNLISKDYSLTRYEMIMMSETVKKAILKDNMEASLKALLLEKIANIQIKYKEEYKAVFNKEPEAVDEVLNKAKINQGALSVAKSAEKGTPAYTPKGSQEAKVYDISNSNEKPSVDQINAMAMENLKRYLGEETVNDYLSKSTGTPISNQASNTVTVENDGTINIPTTVQDFRDQAINSNTPDEMADNMSLINIRKNPQYGDISVGSARDDYNNVQNPIADLNAEDINLSNISVNEALEKSPIDSYEKDSLTNLINAVAETTEKKAKHFFLTLEHNIYYVSEKGEGVIPLDMNNLDVNDKAYMPTVRNQYQLSESVEIGLGVRVHKALDLIVSMIASNEDGAVGKEGTSWEFGNVLFKFHPERLSPLEHKKLNSEGIVVEQGGRVVGKRIGHKTTILTDTKTGSTSITAGSAVLNYDKDEGFTFSNTTGKYFIALGNMSLDLSNYTLQLSDCRAVQVGYHDNNESLILLYGNPNDGGTEGYIDDNGQPVKGIYDSDLFAAQWKTKNLVKNVLLSFNFAHAKDKGFLINPYGAMKGDTTVYSVVVKSEGTGNTSFDGEFAHSVNKYDETDDSLTRSGNADYLDISHHFSKRLTGNLHLINIDGTYDAGSLIEDRTGDYILTTNQGDGEKDYLYQPGQKGLDLTLNYQFPENASIAFGYSRYKETTTQDAFGNPVSKTQFFLSGDKQWDLYNSYGQSRGTVGFQQRFEYNDVSNVDYVKKRSESTLSYQGAPWEDGEVSSDYQKIIDNADGNEDRFDLTVAHHFYPLSRVSVTPKVEYVRKVGEAGVADTSTMDSSVLVNSLTIGYELIPEELTANLLIAKEKYNVIQSEIDEATGKKIDGESRNVLGVGLGLVWEPKKIAGLTVGLSYRKDKVNYITPVPDTSHQNTWEYNIEYSRPLSDNIRASISYDYKSTRDRVKPIYDDVTRTVEIDIDAQIGSHSSIQLSHSYESEYKPLDMSANHKTHTTVLQMKNKF